MTDTATIPVTHVVWKRAVRIVRSIYPTIDLFEDIADPADWALLISAEQKTNPRLMQSIGNLDLVPVARRVSGPGASYLMSPFTHVSTDRKSRFSDGSYGVLYAGNSFNVALLETMYHHARFMARTREPAGWTSQFREISMRINAQLHDLRGPEYVDVLDRNDYSPGQTLSDRLHKTGSDGVVYTSVRCADGECAGLFYPDLASHPIQARHLDYHWDGTSVNLYRVAGTGEVFRVVA